MENCIFCKIVSGDIDAAKVYEDDYTLAFLSIEPIHKGHILIIPKKHIDYVKDIDLDTYEKVMSTTHKMMNLVDKTYNPPRVGLLVEGWEVAHAHVHVIPLYEVDDVQLKPISNGTAPKFSNEELESIAEELRQNLDS